MKQSFVAIYPRQNGCKGSRIPVGCAHTNRVANERKNERAHPNRIANGRRLVFGGHFARKKVTVSVSSNSFPEGKIPYHLRYGGVVSSSVVLYTGATGRDEITLARAVRFHPSGGTFILSIQVGDDKPLQLEYYLTYKNYEARLTKSQKQAMESHLVYDHTKGTFQRVDGDIVDADVADSTTLLDRSFAQQPPSFKGQKTPPQDSATLFERIFAREPPIFGEQQTKKRPLQDNGSKGWVTRIIENPSGISLPPLKKQALRLDTQPTHVLPPIKITTNM